jgi:hypothetical protein
MTAERSSETQDSHQVRATIGLAGGGRRSLRSPVAPASGVRASSGISAAATRPERWALRAGIVRAGIP